jgi:hypothetical protein
MNGYPHEVVAYFTVPYTLLKISNVDSNAPDNGQVGRKTYLKKGFNFKS